MVKKREIQEVLIKTLDKIPNNTTNNTTLNMLPANGWLTLAQFANYKIDDMPRGLSPQEIMGIVGDHMHFNTINNMIQRLKKLALIRELPDRYGKTGRQKKYVVTTDGLILWEKYARTFTVKFIN